MKMLQKTVMFCALLASLNMFALPNPASENCIRAGGRSEIRSTDRGDQYGVCVWGERGSNYSECEEWRLLRGQCQQGQCPQWSADYDRDGNFLSFCSEEL